MAASWKTSDLFSFYTITQEAQRDKATDQTSVTQVITWSSVCNKLLRHQKALCYYSHFLIICTYFWLISNKYAPDSFFITLFMLKKKCDPKWFDEFKIQLIKRHVLRYIFWVSFQILTFFSGNFTCSILIRFYTAG